MTAVITLADFQGKALGEEFFEIVETYYCVVKGWDTGVFDNLDAFLRATDGYPGAHFKVCKGLQEVDACLGEHRFCPRMDVYR